MQLVMPYGVMGSWMQVRALLVPPQWHVWRLRLAHVGLLAWREVAAAARSRKGTCRCS